MELTFPFKNITIHDILRFVDPWEILNFIHVKSGTDSGTTKNFNTYIEIYNSALPNFENELLQVIETTNQETIDSYFALLANDISYIKEKIDKIRIEEIISEFNKSSLKRFEEEAEKNTEEYFKSENRKLNHLEEYDGIDHFSIFYFNHPTKTKLINYNFYCIEKTPQLIDLQFLDDFYLFITDLFDKFMIIATKYGKQWYKGEIKTKHISFNKPILFLEGELDILYLKTAAKFLNEEEILARLDIRQRGGYKNLDKLWQIYKSDNWETVPQKKIFLYDCDVDKPTEDNGYNYKRTIPLISENPIKKGIENLFNRQVIDKIISNKPSLVDIVTVSGIKRGNKYSNQEFNIDHQEKRNFCDWICENGDEADFENFKGIFNMIRTILQM